MDNTLLAINGKTKTTNFTCNLVFQKVMFLHLEFTNSTCFHQASFNSIILKNEDK